MKKKPSYKIQAILGIVAVIALLLSFSKVSDFVAGLFGATDKEALSSKIAEVAKIVFVVTIGLMLVSSGIAVIAFPIIGLPMIVIGVALVAYGLWPLFTSDEAQRPDNTRLPATK